MRWLDEQRGLYHALGPARYWTIIVGTVVFCNGFGTLVWWLSDKIGWPDAYGFNAEERGACSSNGGIAPPCSKTSMATRWPYSSRFGSFQQPRGLQ